MGLLDQCVKELENPLRFPSRTGSGCLGADLLSVVAEAVGRYLARASAPGLASSHSSNPAGARPATRSTASETTAISPLAIAA